MTPTTLDAEPACPDGVLAQTMGAASSPGTARLHAEPRRAVDIPESDWDALAARTPWATPFSGWAFQRAWWDALGPDDAGQTSE